VTKEGHSHAERQHRLSQQRSVVVDITRALYQHAVVVRDAHLGGALWHGSFSDPCTRQELSELAWGASQSRFDPKAVLIPLGRMQRHPTKELPK
jgi:hypothetical protein